MEFDSGNEAIIEIFRQWGLSHYFGVTGGGIIHMTKHLEPWKSGISDNGQPWFLTVNEYVAGFAPLGHYWATGRPAVCLVTTGAATKLALCGCRTQNFTIFPRFILFHSMRPIQLGNPRFKTSQHTVSISCLSSKRNWEKRAL